MDAARRSHIALVTTGGTIAMRYDPQAGGGVSALEADDLLRLLPDLPVTLESESVSLRLQDATCLAPT
jgi:L-asparaginase/Glu-tRNA(Gln) amidotransferase subunit D